MPKTGTLTKAHTIENIAEANGFSRIKTVETTKIMPEMIKSNLASGQDVLISGFSKFCVKKKSKRRGRNPATGKDIMLRSRRVAISRCSGTLREKINAHKL
jgi:integration host factor subunit alpha